MVVTSRRVGERGFLDVEEVLAYFGGDTAKGRRRYEEFVMEGMSGEIPNPLEKGKGHRIIGTSGFIKKIKEQYIQFATESRELPAVKKILAQVEPERIIRVICEALKVEREELLRKGYRGVARGVLIGVPVYKCKMIWSVPINSDEGSDLACCKTGKSSKLIYLKSGNSFCKKVLFPTCLAPEITTTGKLFMADLISCPIHLILENNS